MIAHASSVLLLGTTKYSNPPSITHFIISARNSATHIISIPLFVGLWKALEEAEVPVASSTEAAISRSIQIIEMRFVDIHFVFALISERLSSFLREDKTFIRWEELRRAMAREDIRLTEKLYLTFQRCLEDSGIFQPSPENKVNKFVLMKVSDFFRDRSLEEVCTVGGGEGGVAGDPHDPDHMNYTVARLVRELSPHWAVLREQLCGTERNVFVSEDQLLRAVRGSGGLVMSAQDMHELWNYVTKKSGLDGTQSERLPLSTLDDVLIPKESNYSSFSALMRDEHHPATVRPYTGNPNKVDHLTSLFQEQQRMDLTSNSPPPSCSRPHTASSFPWQRDEANAVSNVKTRVVAGLRRAGSDKQRAFINALYHNEKHYRNRVLPRGVLLEAFACADIHLNRHDAQELWDEAHATLPPPLRVEDLQRWLELEHVTPPAIDNDTTLSSKGQWTGNGQRKTLSLAEMSYDRHNRRYQAHHAPAWGPLDGSGSPYREAHGGSGRNGSADAIYDQGSPRVSDVDGPDAYGSAVYETPPESPSNTMMTPAVAAEAILTNQAHLAYCFRTLSSGGGLVKGPDLVKVLADSPFNIRMSRDALWAMVCGMAGTSPDAAEAHVYLRFNDAVRYLEAELQKTTLPPADLRHRNIFNKLHRSRFVKGSSAAMLEQANILRQRLKYSRQRGPVVSWDGVPDVCSPHEFLSLMNTIDVPLTLDEVEYIYDNVRILEARERDICGGRDEEQCMAYQIEHGFSLGCALRYLSDLLAYV